MAKSAMEFYNENKAAIQAGKTVYGTGNAAYQLGKTADMWTTDYVSDFADMTTPEVDKAIKNHFSQAAADWIRSQYALSQLSTVLENDGVDTAKSVLSAASGFDPSGVTGVAAAYTNPKCVPDDPFPTVKPLY
jgi:hypothetical protein